MAATLGAVLEVIDDVEMVVVPAACGWRAWAAGRSMTASIEALFSSQPPCHAPSTLPLLTLRSQ
jgi:hypothetical protein